MSSDVLALGYTCVCGAAVRVFEMTRDETSQLPRRVTVSCPNGHVATFTSKDVGLLEAWADLPDSAAEFQRAA